MSPSLTTPSRAPSRVSRHEFESLIDAITAHNIAQTAAAHRGAAPRPYMLSEGLANDNPDFHALPVEAQEALESDKNANEERLKKEQVQVAGIAEKRYAGEVSAGWFEEQVDDQINRNIEEYAKRQRELARKLKDVGAKNPEAQALIVQGFAAASKFFSELWNAVTQWLGSLVQHLVDLWNKVKDFFEDSWKSIIDWWRIILG